MPPRVSPPLPPPDTDSIFYIHPSEGPNSVVVTPKLNGSNFLAWSRSMQRALGAKNKLRFVDGSLEIPPIHDLNRTSWERCNHLIHSWILNSVSEQIASTIVFHESAIEAWQDLHERFSKIDRVRIATLRSSINNLKQGTRSVLDYFIELKALWEELNSHHPIPVCICVHPCRCPAMQLVRNYGHEDQVLQFLQGLNDNFSIVKTQVLLLDPLPTINKVYSLVVQEESNHKSIASHDDSSSLINAAQRYEAKGKGIASSSQSKNSNRQCTFCHRSGHTVDFCYQKHGHPSFKKNRSSVNAANTQVVQAPASVSNTEVGSSSGTSSPISQEQFGQLMALLHQTNLLPASENSAPSSSTNQFSATPMTQGHPPHESSSGILLTNVNSLTANHDYWLLDFGANDHVCSSYHHFSSFYPIKPVHIKLPNGHSVIVQYAGNIQFSESLYLTDVLYSPEFHLNLISVSKLCKNLNCSIQFFDHKCLLQDMITKKMIGLGDQVDGLYRLQYNHTFLASQALPQSFPKSINNVAVNSVVIPVSALWHFRLGHVSNNRLLRMSKLYPFLSIDNKAVCDVCQFARKRKLPFNSSYSTALHAFDLIHFDIWGPLAVSSIHGHKYFLTILDDHTRYVWIVLLKSKSEVASQVQNFIQLIENQFHKTPKIVRADNGLEFSLPSFYASKGIIHQKSCVETRQQNGRVERKHQHLLNVVFGCLCYASTISQNRTKLDPKARKSIFLGYNVGMKGYVLLDLHSKETFTSRHVSFHEHILPYTSNSSSETHNWDYFPSSPTNNILPSSTSDTPLHINIPTAPSSAPCHTPISHPTNRISTRSKTKPSYLQDYVCHASTASLPSCSQDKLYPISDYMSYSNLSSNHCAFALSLMSHSEPKTYDEASKFECWNQAMRVELEALEKTGTWLLVDLPPTVKPIGCRWVYRIKYNADGSIERYKARLIAKGYNQIEGLDYFDTYSPVAKLTTVRTVIALASINNWIIHQLDVNNAFLHGELQEDVYMIVPPGVTCSKPNQVCKLVKSLYGLKQASRRWYERLTAFLQQHHYIQATSDHSLFLKKNGSTITILLVYVDDVIVAGNSMTDIQAIKNALHESFKIKDLGILKYFLGIEVAHSKEGISLCQRKYCLDLLDDSGMIESKPASTPSDPSTKLHQDSSAPYPDIPSYRRLVGRLLYLNATRPDITFSTQQLSQFLSKPTMAHFKAATRVLRYLKTCPGRGIMMPRDSIIHLQGFSDADWAGCIDTRRSISGQCFLLGKSLISWRTKKQLTVSRSSSEAEYKALAAATCEMQWLLYLLNDLQVQSIKLPVLFCDNQSALHIAANPVFHKRTKHLEIDCHIVRERLNSGMMKFLPVSTKNQLADFFTKPLLPQPFHILLSKLEMKDIYKPPTCGGLLNHVEDQCEKEIKTN
ncbi:hypothetical protein TSUD_58210 [Trifolium subterraneum]|uniref:Integrase catalytic domain-containing protein n=1 Tax=Trifolium subterraneum TaxID=3900 RepID=A0A2Z6N6S4_TRISU|nr:hypothetical protein TSUD_58210 [Trifolium subterraneum]